MDVNRDHQRISSTEDESAAREYRSLIEYLPAVIYTAEPGVERRWLYVSPQSKTILGFTYDELRADPLLFYQQVHPEDRPRLIAEEARSRSSETSLILEFRFFKSDGSLIWLREKSLLMRDPVSGKRYFQGFMFDVTEAKRTEEQLRERDAQLRQSQKMEAIGRLAGGIAHDFNNILSVVINYAGFLKDELEPGDPKLEDVKEIRLAGERAAKLVRQLLAFSREEVVDPEVLDLSEVIGGIKDLLQRTIGEDVELVFTPCPRPCLVEIDQSQVERVLMNLAVNARDAMPDGGTLTIATSGVTVTRSLAAASPALEPGRYVSLTVSDTGCGMSQEVAERIFEPFFTTKPRGEGTGLGLATVYGIVTQATGSVAVHTEQGEGTSFEIFLPFSRKDARAIAGAGNDHSEDRGRETVLVVEDEAPVRELVCRILKSSGYDVISVGSGAEALHVTRTRLEDIDLLITDVVMPQMSGKTLADRLTGARPGIRVLFMSGYDDDIVSRRGVGEDADNFIPKPFTSEDLVVKVRSILSARVD